MTPTPRPYTREQMQRDREMLRKAASRPPDISLRLATERLYSLVMALAFPEDFYPPPTQQECRAAILAFQAAQEAQERASDAGEKSTSV